MTKAKATSALLDAYCNDETVSPKERNFRCRMRPYTHKDILNRNYTDRVIMAYEDYQSGKMGIEETIRFLVLGF